MQEAKKGAPAKGRRETAWQAGFDDAKDGKPPREAWPDPTVMGYYHAGHRDGLAAVAEAEAQEEEEAEACAAATLEYARKKAGGADTLTYRDGVRDALCGMYGPRALGVPPESLPYDYLAGRDTAMAVRGGAAEPDSPPGERDYWLGFLHALRFEHYNDIDPSDWYCAGVEDGEVARERIDEGGVIGGYTETDAGHQHTAYRVVVTVPGSNRLPDRGLGPYTEWSEAAKDRDALRAVGRDAKVEGVRYSGALGDGRPLRMWEEIEAL